MTVIVPCWNGEDTTMACLRAVAETLPADVDVEVLAVDDASTDGTARALAAAAAEWPWLRVLRNEVNRGFIESCNLGAREAHGDVLVLLNNDTLPLPGWLEPLVTALQRDPLLGAVGGRLLFPDGSLQEAGGVVFADGSAANFGRRSTAPADPLFSFTRDVDYCSGALLATRRSLFLDLGGFDRRFLPAYFEDTDYCFAVRDAGLRVRYEPDSSVVHLEGFSSGTDPTAGVKRHQQVNQVAFTEKWRHVLHRQPDRPSRFDRRTWYALSLPRGARP